MDAGTEQYRSLKDRVDARSFSLAQLHACHLACKPGCHDCCTDFSVFAVEYDSILAALREAKMTLPPPDPNASCSFLQNGLCAIYEYRPIICRTHGLPIAFLDESEDSSNVDFCPKNFTNVPPAQLAFDAGNTLDLDELNIELNDINAHHPSSMNGRIPLRQLHADLDPDE